jgi:23S rRNA (uracil1939-C5)-methyltransferase
MVHGGVTLARLTGGRLALVRGGLPGERVKATLKERSGVLQGVVEEVIDASPYRAPAHAHPGLDYSHMTYAHQLELKRSVVIDALERSVKRTLPVSPVRAAPEPWGYRHAVQPAVSRTESQTLLGYRRPESHDFVPLPSDPTASEGVNRIWSLLSEPSENPLPKGVREIALRSSDTGEVLLCLIASASAKNYLEVAHSLLEHGVAGVAYAQYDARGRFRRGSERLAGARSIGQRYGDFELSVTATSFAQPNPAAASQLYAELVRWAGEGNTALDLYAGSGIIGFHLSRRFEHVVALELDRSSVVRGERDAARLGLANVAFVHADARKAAALPEADLITVDPPRAGLAKETRRAIDASSARRLIYVSCDVATWARDVSEFEGMGWTLERAQPFDFYPQTHHIEMLSLLTR